MDPLILCGALLLDAILGDPPWRFHPVRLIGALAADSEEFWRKRLSPTAAGRAAWITVVLVTILVSATLLFVCDLSWKALFAMLPALPAHAAGWGPKLASIFLLWSSIAPRDLATHALRVAASLRDKGVDGGEVALGPARRALSMIVGRDVEVLDDSGIARAAVESVAESSVDGVLAPLFWFFVLGPLGAMAYRAINTMDSMFGHKNERYILFGRLAAQADDVANWIPARLSLPCIALAAFLTRLDWRAALRIGLRDRKKHESPNAAWPEAAFAGALGLRLAGPLRYSGELHDKPFLGEGRLEALPRDIGRAVVLMYLAILVPAAFAAAIVLAMGGT